MIGKVIKNNYKIMDEIGRGSVATVYLAKDTVRNQVVALKIIHPEQAAEGQFLQRFQREAKLLQMLSSPQAVKVLDYGEDKGLNFIALEYVQGKTLASLLEEERALEINRALDISRQVALCLVDAHAKSIVHRDLRPANIMVTAEEAVKVMDLGIAWGADLSRLTATGVLGSPHYLSPEQASGGQVDGRSDIYSLGVTLFEMLSGKRPYDADSAVDTVLAHLRKPIPSLHQLDGRVPLEVDELVRKCLAKKPEDRYQSAAELLEAIDVTLQAIAKRKEGVTMGMEAGLVGQTMGAYRVVEQIGRGGMATVYKAYEPALDRYVAIKVLPQYFAHDPDFVARFEREAKAVAKLNHPNILPIYSFGQEAGLTYIAMRYVEAGTLKDMLGKPLDLKTAADILGQIGQALDYAHRQGVVHRDVKPTNVLMAEGKWALLTDFGLARMVESSVQLTKTGVGVGTPAYMSPEQGQGLKVDARSDVYSLGVVLYEMATGKVPYEAETPMAVVLKHITAPLPLPREVNPGLPEVVERVILKAMAKAPEDRYQTAGELVEALEKAVAGMPVVERPPEAKPVPLEKAPSTVVAEFTPAPVAAVPVEAPPVAKKGLPGWVWGMVGAAVLLIAAGGVFLATRGEKPSPTPAATAALVATPTSLPLAIPTATAVPLKPVSPGNPPEDRAEVQPCQWGDHGPGLCIFSSGSDTPAKILTDAKLEIAASTSWSPDGQRIAFSALKPSGRPESDNRLYIVNTDGSGLTELPSVGNDIAPAWSPDGQWLAFHSSCNLAIMHPDGSEPAWVWRSGGDKCAEWIEWSPNSQQLVVSIVGEWTFPMTREVWVISRDGATVNTAATITHKDDKDVRVEVAFSPDGTQVAYVDDNGQSWIVNADGFAQATPLTEFPFWWTSRVYPQWGGKKGAPPPKPVPPAQPEGKVVEGCGGKPPQLCMRDTQTGQVTQVTNNLEFEGIGPCAWSPDGQQIIFNAGSDFEVTQRHDHKLYIINADGSGLRQVTSGDTNDLMPTWSPDGQWIAFHRNCALWVIRPDGSDARPLLEQSDKLCATTIVWSPDSQQIAFLNQPDFAREVWIVNRDGTDPRPVYAFDLQLQGGDVAWSPDGQQIAYLRRDNGGKTGFLINADGSGKSQMIEEGVVRKVLSWLPNTWPQWGGKQGAPPSPPPGSSEAAPVPADPWGQVVVPPRSKVSIAVVGTSADIPQISSSVENAVRMAAEEAGSVQGFPVSVLAFDGGCSVDQPGQATSAAAQVASDPTVAGVVGHLCSASCVPGSDVYEKAHLVMISPSCTGPPLTERGLKVVNRVCTRDDQGGDERNRQLVNTGAYQDFARRYQDRYGQSLDSIELGFYAAYAYDATAILIKAVERVAAVDGAGNLVIGRQALANAVRATSGHQGVTSTIGFDGKGDRLP